MDGLHTTVTDTLASGYCPTNEGVFVTALLSCVGVPCALGFILSRVAAHAAVGVRFKFAALMLASFLVLFALGAGAFELFGISGCDGRTIDGLTRDYPW